MEALSEERDRLLAERDDLKGKCDELQDEIKFGQANKSRDGGAGGHEGDTDSGEKLR